ncbi:MAG TPA: DUF488 family protein [bacterium]|nr:DUF488 family protein [bacterium]
MISVRRVYEVPSDKDGIRILVDRLWPRGISKEKAEINFWFKDIAPSNELRKSYHSAAIDFNEFKRRYLLELSESKSGDSLIRISEFIKAGDKNITLLYGLKDEINNNAAVLKEFILNKFIINKQ